MDKPHYNVLLIEDSPEDRETYRRLLKRHGEADYTFVETDSGEQAVALCRSAHPDCVLLDYRLPDRDGLELLEELTRQGESPVAVVMLTGHGDESIAVQAMKCGAQDYLVKGRMTPAELAGAVHNAIARAALLQRVERAQRHFRLAVEASPSAMVLVDARGSILLVNSQTERLFGYGRDELIGQPVEVLIPPEDRGSHEGPRSAILDLRSSLRELRGRKKDGSEFVVEVGVNPIDNEQGPMVLASMVDISERKRLEEERRNLERRMQEAQKFESLGVLAGGIAHRFNNLLVGVLGNASLVRLGLAPDSPVRPIAEHIEQSAQQIAELCQQMLAFSGRGRFVIQPLNLSALVAEMRPLLEVSAARGAALEYDLDADLPPVEADAAQIRQVIVNLVTNASEALGPQGGKVALRTRTEQCASGRWPGPGAGEWLPEGMYVCLEVSDTGCGMDEATRKRIFDPFFTTKFTGRGLGLAAVLGIVRGHRGAIEVESIPRQGTTFRAYFPAAARTVPVLPPVVARPPRAGGVVLVVDDEEMVRKVTAAALQAGGFTVLTARDGEEAVAAIRTRGEEIALVLLDLVMPGVGGEVVYRQMRAIRPDVRVLLVSGYDEKEASARFAAEGLAGFVQKPWSFQALLTRVRELLTAK